MEQKQFLIIEDDAAICELLVNCLGRLNGRISVAHSGEEGLRLIEEDRPHLLILDLTLPGMNGLDVCRTMRRDPWMEKIPVLMLTGRDGDDDIVTGLEVGADDYMTKPFKPKVLAARIRALLRRRGEADDGQSAPDSRANDNLLEIRSLGRCELQLGARVVSWAETFSPNQRMLLAALLATPDGRVPQEELQLGFWPDTPPARARSNFDSLMTRLRRTFEQEFETIDVRRHLQLCRGIVCLEHVRVDAHEFRRLADRGLQQAAVGELWPAEIAFSAAFSLWQGNFLPGGFGSEAATLYQDELEQLYLEASQKFARILAEGGRHQEAVKLLRYALRYNLTHDGINRLLYQMLVSEENLAQARQQRDNYAGLLARENFSAEEIRSIISEFPQRAPKGGWLKE